MIPKLIDIFDALVKWMRRRAVKQPIPETLRQAMEEAKKNGDTSQVEHLVDDLLEP